MIHGLVVMAQAKGALDHTDRTWNGCGPSTNGPGVAEDGKKGPQAKEGSAPFAPVSATRSSDVTGGIPGIR